LFAQDYHEPACFKKRRLFLDISQRDTGEASVALNAGVMRRFERVVASLDPKDIEFPQPQQHFPQIGRSGPVGAIE
jgi:hypothetical protein